MNKFFSNILKLISSIQQDISYIWQDLDSLYKESSVGDIKYGITPATNYTWLPCDGREYLNAQYETLSQKLKTDNLRIGYLSEISKQNIKRSIISNNGDYLAILLDTAESFATVLKRIGDTFKPFSQIFMGEMGASISTIGFSPNGKYLVVTSSNYFEGNKFYGRIYTLNNGEYRDISSLNYYPNTVDIRNCEEINFFDGDNVLILTATDFIIPQRKFFVFKRTGNSFSIDENSDLLPLNNMDYPEITINEQAKLIAVYGNDKVDSSSLVYLYHYNGTTFDIVTMTTPTGVSLYQPYFSDDGQTLVFDAYDDTNSVVVLPVYKKSGDSFVALAEITLPADLDSTYVLSLSETGQYLFLCYTDASSTIHNVIFTRNGDSFNTAVILDQPSDLSSPFDYVKGAEFINDNYLVLITDLTEGPGAVVIYKKNGTSFEIFAINYDVKTVTDASFDKTSRWIVVSSYVDSDDIKSCCTVLGIDQDNFAVPLEEGDIPAFIRA